MRKCPKCQKRLSPFYFKTACGSCGADLLYYRFDERLALDAQKAAAQEEKLRRALQKLPFFKKKDLHENLRDSQ